MKKVKTFKPYQRSMKWKGTKYIKFKLGLKPGFKPFGPLRSGYQAIGICNTAPIRPNKNNFVFPLTRPTQFFTNLGFFFF